MTPTSSRNYKEVDRTQFIRDWMDACEDSERSRILYQWEISESIQESNPFVEWGWDGFVPVIIHRWSV